MEVHEIPLGKRLVAAYECLGGSMGSKYHTLVLVFDDGTGLRLCQAAGSSNYIMPIIELVGETLVSTERTQVQSVLEGYTANYRKQLEACRGVTP